MVVPIQVSGPETGGPEGYSYAAILIRDTPGDAVRAALRELRFSGWLAPLADGWLPIVPAGVGTVASGRRGVAEVAGELAGRFPTVVAARVRDDRQLLLAVWTDGTELGRYLSDPSREPGADDDVLPAPYGVRYLAGFAAACGHPEAAGDLTELLAEPLDQERVIESERLAALLRLLAMPTWLVAAAALPREIPTGPDRRSLTRLGFGRTGVPGFLAGRAANVVRKRRPPPPAVTDAPRGDTRLDPWLL